MHQYWRNISIAGIILSGIGIFHGPIYELSKLSLGDPLYSHIPLVPIVSGYLLWINRKSIFSSLGSSPIAGIGIMAAGIVITLFQNFFSNPSSESDALLMAMVSLMLWVIGGFLLVCGWQCFRKAIFPILFLAFMLPVPSVLLDQATRVLQMGSVEATQVILAILDVPVYREGVYISLPGVTVEIAKECSGIRSTMALIVLCTVASYVFLRSKWRRFVLILMVIPISIIKNGMRIVTLSMLGAYVDMAYISDSAVHSSGGKPFFVIAVLMMSPILWVLRRSEISVETKRSRRQLPQKPLIGATEISKDTPIVP